VRLRGGAAGYLGLVVLWTVVQTKPAGRLGGLADDLIRLLSRLFDPDVAGVPNKHDGSATDINQTSPPGGQQLPADAGAPPNCPPGFTPRFDNVAHKWLCLSSEDPRNPKPPAGGGLPPGSVEDFRSPFSSVRSAT